MISFDLPSITLPGHDDIIQVRAKRSEEYHEWLAETASSANKIVEAWDYLQAAVSALRCVGSDPHTDIFFYTHAQRILMCYRLDGIDIMKGKRQMLLKNALRGYYHPTTCEIIIDTDGAEWRSFAYPLDRSDAAFTAQSIIDEVGKQVQCGED